MKLDILQQFQSLDFKTKNYGEKELLKTSRTFHTSLQVCGQKICKHHCAAIVGDKYLTVGGNRSYK